MKALISFNELFTHIWISSWDEDTPVYSEILNCQRVAQVEPDNKVFEVHSSLIWVDCPEECKADEWYYKDGQVQLKPTNVPKPEEV